MVDEVGRDAVRFMMLFRKNDAVLDFDLAKVIEQSRDNPVFYVQYGHARGQSIFRNARAAFPDLPDDVQNLVEAAELERLSDPAELALMRQIALYPRIVEAAAAAHEPHRIAFYLFHLASEFHVLYTLGNTKRHLRFIIQNERQTTVAWLVLVQGVVSVLSSGLRCSRSKRQTRCGNSHPDPVRDVTGADDGVSPVSRKPPGPRRNRWPTTIFVRSAAATRSRARTSIR